MPVQTFDEFQGRFDTLARRTSDTDRRPCRQSQQLLDDIFGGKDLQVDIAHRAAQRDYIKTVFHVISTGLCVIERIHQARRCVFIHQSLKALIGHFRRAFVLDDTLGHLGNHRTNFDRHCLE